MKFRPTLGSDYSGKLGGNVASHNTYGSYFRRLVKPVNPRSPGMVAQRAAFGSVTQQWRSLSKSQQALWIAAAPTLPQLTRKGGTQVLTGQALFMALNVLPIKAGAPLIITPPASATVAGLTAPLIVLNASGLFTITYNADEWNVANGCVGASVSPPITNGRNFIGQFNTLGTSVFPAAADIEYISAFQIPEGGVVDVQFKAETPDGRRSQIVTVRATAISAGLTSAVAASSQVTVTDKVAVKVGQVFAFNNTTHLPLISQSAGNLTVLHAAPGSITAGDSIGSISSFPGINDGGTPVVAT